MDSREINLISEKQVAPIAQPSFLRVAAYCRVSNPSEEQSLSLDAQIQYYTQKINQNPCWQNAGIFGEAATGLNSKKRPAFNALMKKCSTGKVNVIITKSISRFGRNTLDTVVALRKLQELGVDVWFEQENLRLLDEKTRLAIEIYCALAQNESEENSKNIRWGVKAGFRSGMSGYQHFTCYGYRFDEQCQELMIVPEEAETVKMIFNLRVHGSSYGAISKQLAQQQIPSPTGKPVWNRECIRKLLQNEKYVGDVLLQKTYVADLFTGKQTKNVGHQEKFLYRNNHEAIIAREIFELLQRLKK